MEETIHAIAAVEKRLSTAKYCSTDLIQLLQHKVQYRWFSLGLTSIIPKALLGALQDIVESAVANIFDDDDGTDFGFKAIAQLPPDVLGQLNINATELALASGQMQIKDSFFRGNLSVQRICGT